MTAFKNSGGLQKDNMQRLILVKYGEIHLKGLNRPFFKKALKDRLKGSLLPFGCNVFEAEGRMYIEGYRQEDEKEVINRAKNTFGVHAVCPSVAIEKESDSLFETAANELVRAMKEQGKEKATFKVKAKRQDKNFHLNSEQICRETGAYILDKLNNVTVDVHVPMIEVNIEIRDRAYIYAYQQMGPGGMPLGTSGKAALMISGGIDSPVAGYMMAGRGLNLTAVHFLSPPYTGEKAKQKVIDLVKKLSEYCGGIELHLVHFTNIQEKIYEKCSGSLLTIIMRRFMVRITERIAKKAACGAMITGESLGQVASQTLNSLNVTNITANMPVFRPLIGMDKNEIIDRARKIGTFDISIQPGEDCCTVFVPKHPSTMPSLIRVTEEEAKLDFEELIEEALRLTEIIAIKQIV